jgi:hypothetical protein
MKTVTRNENLLCGLMFKFKKENSKAASGAQPCVALEVGQFRN